MSEPGSDQWVIDRAQQAAKDAQPQLVQIAEAAFTRHHGKDVSVSPRDMTRLAMILAEIQDQSFLLGVQIGMRLVIETSKEA